MESLRRGIWTMIYYKKRLAAIGSVSILTVAVIGILIVNKILSEPEEK